MDFTEREAATRPAPNIVRHSVREWEERIRTVQSKRATPAVIAKLKAQNEKQRSAASLTKKSMRIERTNMLNCAQSAMALQTFSRAATPAAFEESSKRTAEFGKSINNCLAKTKARYLTSHSTRKSDLTLPDSDAEMDHELDELADEMRRELGAQDALAAPSAASATLRRAMAYESVDIVQQQQISAAMSTELEILLQQLAREPTEAAEVTAKFMLFETYLANVVSIREEMFGFWEESKHQFAGSVLSSCEREIREIDSEEAQGLVDDPQTWFVYGMTKKASDNSTKISQILSALRARLELLSQDIGECPYCLDVMHLESSTVLGCCHRVCTNCWEHWVELKKEAAFCPLCRHEEFMSDILG